MTPGVELALEAYEQYWRTKPTFVVSGATDAYGGYPDIDDLFLQQARERDSQGGINGQREASDP
jgi:hypothetical protein